VGAAADDADGIGAVDLLGVEVPPHVVEARHARVEVVGIGCQRRGVDRSCRRPGDDRKRICVWRIMFAPDARKRVENADLIRRSRAAAGEDECNLRVNVVLRNATRWTIT